MSIQQDNLNAAFPSPNNGDAVLDSTTGRYWVYSSGSGLWVEYSEGFDLPYLGIQSPIEPYSYIEEYPLGISISLSISAVDWNSTLSTTDQATLGVLIGGQIETIESSNQTGSVSVTVSTFIPTIINDLTKVDVGNTIILTDVPEPSIGASGIRIDNSIINTTANQPEVRTVITHNDICRAPALCRYHSQ